MAEVPNSDAEFVQTPTRGLGARKCVIFATNSATEFAFPKKERGHG